MTYEAFSKLQFATLKKYNACFTIKQIDSFINALFTCTPYTNRLSCIVKSILSWIDLYVYLLDIYLHFMHSNIIHFFWRHTIVRTVDYYYESTVYSFVLEYMNF